MEGSKPVADPSLPGAEPWRPEAEGSALKNEASPAAAEGPMAVKEGSPPNKETPSADAETDFIETRPCTSDPRRAHVRRAMRVLLNCPRDRSRATRVGPSASLGCRR